MRMLKSTRLAAALLATASLGVMASTAQANPPGWHDGGGYGGHGYHHGWGGPVVIVNPYAPPPIYYAPPPPVYYAPSPPVVYAPPPPPPVVYAPAPAPVATGPAYVCTDDGRNTALGLAAGGTAGALIGAASSHHGHTRWGATAGGAILGMLLGGTIGGAVDAANQSCTATAVAYGPVGTPVAWADPNANVQYQVVPTRQYNTNGQLCRDYQANAAIDGQWQQVHGTACQQPDGSWQIVN
jgi:surface antigen